MKPWKYNTSAWARLSQETDIEVAEIPELWTGIEGD